MKVDSHIVIRPDFQIYNPEVKQKTMVYFLLSLLNIVFFILYSIYFIKSLIAIFHLSNYIIILLNIFILLIEIMLGYYSMVLLLHFAKGFKLVNGKLNPLIEYPYEDESKLPLVSILLPMFKEPVSVIKQTLMAALDLNYPKSRYDVYLIEDGKSNDDIEELCKEIGVKYLTRTDRSHFKAGAVNYSLPLLTGDYVVFIDADHILEKNLIINCMLAWRENTIAVQTRIDFVNMKTFLTTISAFLQLQFFSLFQRGRRSNGSAIFAGGSALFDRKLLIKEGGLNPLTIADDTDTSFILRSRGYRIEYIDTVGAWALVPWDPLHLMRQIWRWLTGITRSFRARSGMILKGNNSLYGKIDHFATGFFPTLAILGWLVGFVIIGLIFMDAGIVRDFSILGFDMSILPTLTSSLAMITGILALLLDDKRILFHKKSTSYKIITVFGFYFLILAAQPLLLGAIIKGWIGSKVEFNRTPKDKKINDSGIDAIKKRYLVYSLAIFLIGLIFVVFAFQIPFNDARSITLWISAYAALVPLIVSILWYWKLESYLHNVEDITALKFLENEYYDNLQK
ncbi:MAG: glycosyltransferase [Candidatus Heimdallarchaeota archaeon]|nr:glycosyltransferase [Candidatus Heimdallarchaeota archaeon]MDH5645957.1 glycosyltransferase [Candidatus Heimdallarchaeota archaeon]